jgi:hypothetical protein
MPNFTFTCQHESGETITFETNKEFIGDVISDFELFLKGAGFMFDGYLDFTDSKVQQFKSIYPEPLNKYTGY